MRQLNLASMSGNESNYNARAKYTSEIPRYYYDDKYQTIKISISYHGQLSAYIYLCTNIKCLNCIRFARLLELDVLTLSNH